MIGQCDQSILLKMRRLGLTALLSLAALLAVAGCSRDNPSLSIETDEPLYREGLQLTREGHTQEALAAYLKLIAKRGDQAPESHLDAGLIYLEDIRDQITAIYHFRQYLALEPNSPNATRVRGLIDRATREFARTLPGQPMDSQLGGGQLLDEVDRLQRENDALKAELDAAHAGGSSSPAAAPVAEPGDDTGHIVLAPVATEADSTPTLTPVPAPEAPQAAETQVTEGGEPAPAIAATPAAASAGRSYRVQPHDTLFGIAKKEYGSATNAKVQAILQANRRLLPSATALRPGMELKIP
jgi:phage tail protein X